MISAEASELGSVLRALGRAAAAEAALTAAQQPSLHAQQRRATQVGTTWVISGSAGGAMAIRGCQAPEPDERRVVVYAWSVASNLNEINACTCSFDSLRGYSVRGGCAGSRGGFAPLPEQAGRGVGQHRPRSLLSRASDVWRRARPSHAERS